MITDYNNNILHTARISVHKTEDPHSQSYISALPVPLDCHHAPSASLSYWLADRNNSVTIMWENATLRLVTEKNILSNQKNICTPKYSLLKISTTLRSGTFPTRLPSPSV